MKRYIVANWKQNMTLSEVHSWITKFTDSVVGFSPNVEVVLCPPTPYLSTFASLAQGYDWLHVGSQDVSETELGAHTGNTDVSQIADFAEYSIVGHSERLEDRELVALKVKRCLKVSLEPIVCFVKKEDAKSIYQENLIVAWEDPQNISKGGVYAPKDPADIEEGLSGVSELLPEGATILYGGSVNRDNIDSIVEFKNLGGVILGGASLDARHLIDIITAFK